MALTKIASGTYKADNGTVYAYIILSVTAPDHPNFAKIKFGYKKTTDSEYTLQTGFKYSGLIWRVKIEGLAPGLTYDYIAKTENSYGLLSIPDNPTLQDTTPTDSLDMTFASLTVTNLTGSRFVASSAGKVLQSVSALSAWVAGTANRITITDDGDGTITITIPNTPQLVGMLLSGLTANKLLASDASKNLVSVANLSSWIAGTANRVTVTDDGDGSITITLPDTPQLAGILLSGLTTSRLLASDGSKNLVSTVLASWIATAAAARLTVTDDGDGSVTLDQLGLLADGTAGRVLRNVYLTIEDGTNSETLKCTVVSRWNGDNISVTDNIAKDATTGNFSLNAAGTVLTIEKSGLSGNVLMAFGTLARNESGTDLTGHVVDTNNDIRVMLRGATSGANQDITALADSGDMYLEILYITDA